MPKTEAQKNAQKRYLEKTNYDKVNMYKFLVSLHRENEAEIIDWLSKQDNKNGYIKSLILADMARKQGSST